MFTPFLANILSTTFRKNCLTDLEKQGTIFWQSPFGYSYFDHAPLGKI